MGFWRAIDWQRPWLAPYRAVGEAACVHLDAGDSVHQALNRMAGEAGPRLAAGALRFVSQAMLPAGQAYEAFIHRTASVPTRDNLHDLFNGLVWLTFPWLKQALNALQASEIADSGVGATRGALRDALTLFDENGAFLQAPSRLGEALAQKDWHALFVEHRDDWAHATLVLFGHALLDKLVQPRKAITAHALRVAPDTDLSTPAACAWTPQAWRHRPFLPLPVLGVPGWWAGNEAPGFYDDATVFRPPRAA